MRRAAVTACLALAAVAVGCHGRGVGSRQLVGTGNVVRVSRSATGFHRIHLSGIGKLVVTQADRDAVELSGDANLLRYLESRVAGGVLYLGVRDGVRIRTHHGLTWHVQVRALEAIETDGLVTVEAERLAAEELEVDLDGTTTAWLEGAVGRLRLQLAGIATFRGSGLTCETYDLQGDGILALVLGPCARIVGSVCGVGTIEYEGSPAIALDRCPTVTLRRR